MTELAAPAPRKRRKTEPGERRQAILDAGLAVFAADGFAAAKLDDVAARAGTAKGTIYLYFRDKEDLFEQIIRGAVAPMLNQVQSLAAAPDVATTELLSRMSEMFQTHILGTERKSIPWLVLTEGARFPAIAKFYHDEVVAKGMEMLKLIARRAAARGEPLPPEIEQFPQLLFAPFALALIWDGVFARFAPLNVNDFLAAHLKIVTKQTFD
jgi:AcrR family transcriptional regulator